MLIGIQQLRQHHHILRSILHPYHGTTIFGCYLKGGMHLACCCATHHDRYLHASLLHFASHIHHLVERRSDESAQAYGIGIYLFSLGYDEFGRNHHSQVYYLVIVASHYYTHDIFSDIVNVALYCCQHHLACCCGVAIFLSLYMWLQYAHRLFHGASSLHHLRQKHFSFAK